MTLYSAFLNNITNISIAHLNTITSLTKYAHLQDFIFCILQKLIRRKTALETSSWKQKTKEKVMRVLTVDNMSSEEDDPIRPKVFLVRPKPNQSRKFRMYKRRLDRLARKGEGKRATVQRNEREKGPVSVKLLDVPDNEEDSWIIQSEGEGEAEDSTEETSEGQKTAEEVQNTTEGGQRTTEEMQKTAAEGTSGE